MGKDQLRRLFLCKCGGVFRNAGETARLGEIRRHAVPRPCVTLLPIRAFTSGGNQAIVEVALTQLGNEGGQPY